MAYLKCMCLPLWFLYLTKEVKKSRFNWKSKLKLGLHEKLLVIIQCISSVKPVLWLVVNLHHVLSDGAAFNTHSRFESNRVIDSNRICEIRWWRFSTYHRTSFTDEMHMIIAFDFSCSPNLNQNRNIILQNIFYFSIFMLVYTPLTTDLR